ncbi:CatB-related O-acetyltransferase [Paenibacillus sp. TRM 82003]|nr:CatB-related O-acetyltransferase [Paenibacillus sp. TRM 82003]MCI3923463.1 CatB-related O-acetyltransferase [Paenibacillus sp. TRM 82003]
MNKNPAYKDYEIGDWTYGNPAVVFGGPGGATLKIGKYCSIAAGVTIMLGGEHYMDRVTTYPFQGMIPEAMIYIDKPFSKGDVKIGHDVWIGLGATIMSGVNIGNGAVIATQSLVVKDVPPYAIVGGNPAKVIRYRFSPEVIKEIEESRWWDWPYEKLQNNWKWLLTKKT